MLISLPCLALSPAARSAACPSITSKCRNILCFRQLPSHNLAFRDAVCTPELLGSDASGDEARHLAHDLQDPAVLGLRYNRSSTKWDIRKRNRIPSSQQVICFSSPHAPGFQIVLMIKAVPKASFHFSSR